MNPVTDWGSCDPPENLGELSDSREPACLLETRGQRERKKQVAMARMGTGIAAEEDAQDMRAGRGRG